jgi:hypothetical protein
MPSASTSASNSVVQAVLFRKVDWNLQNSLKWLENNHFKAKKIDITNNWFRYRLLEPLDLKKKGFTHYANKYIENDSINLVIAYK